MEGKIFKTEIEGKEISVELNRLAEQANGSAVIRYGQTVVLATAVMSDRISEKTYLPLTVDYEERFYAAGKIKGSRWVKREGRPTDEAILTGRLIDRAIRPLFNPKSRNDIQVIVTVLSFDGENDPSLPALVGASLALATSNIPWQGPIAGISVGQDEKGGWIITSTISAKAKSGIELFVSGIEREKDVLINMMEGNAFEMPESKMIEGIELATKHIKNLLEFQKKIIAEVNPQKTELKIEKIDETLKQEIEKFIGDKIEKDLYSEGKTKLEKNSALDQLQESLLEYIEEKYPEEKKKIALAQDYFEGKVDKIVHEHILKHNERPDKRKLDELRKITAEIGILPRTHGSGLFHRGETQVLSVVTLGSPGAEQYLDQMELEGKKSFMHDYNFPPFSVGEVGRVGSPGRREIGHGALAEKALQPIIPDKESFPYTIRVVSEVLSSNGSSSMASVCGSILALLDGGIPIKENVAGIAMGLMSEGSPADGKYKILTDIQGPEDHYGDMDLKVAGTRKGINAIQMDVKIDGVNTKILEETFKQAKKARVEILDIMEKTIKEPRPELSPYAPRVYTLKINPAKIGLIIGSGGKTINEITSETGASIDIEDDGTIFVTCEDADSAKRAISWIKTLTREAKMGEVFGGKVVKTTEFGAFVELFPGQDGLLHISELGKNVNRVEDVVRQGDIVEVRVKKIDENGKIGLELNKIIQKK